MNTDKKTVLRDVLFIISYFDKGLHPVPDQISRSISYLCSSVYICG